MRTKFIISFPGDKSVGIDPESTEVIVNVYPKDTKVVNFISEQLQECFKNIWDDSRVVVWSESSL